MDWVNLLKDRNDYLISRSDALATKALGIFTVAAAIIGIAIPLSIETLNTLDGIGQGVAIGLIGFATISFIITAFLFGFTYAPTRYKNGPKPSTILNEYLNGDDETACKDLIYYMGEWWSENNNAIAKKATLINIMLVAATVEILAVVAWGLAAIVA